MKPSVYIETSVVSAIDDSRDDPISQAQSLITKDWWENQRRHFDLYYSQAVVAELNRIEFPGQRAALSLLDEMMLLPITPDVDGVAEAYRQHLVMPSGEMGDAVHLAVACVHEVDYLLTWNCRHIANTNKIQHIRVINMRLGLLTPVMLTPEMLVGEEKNDAC
ncbi:MAG: type II toxin-antitoxin system VapC family toxin [Phycisphaerae bacterium]|nr:type II toxin-antitoxin system VapC family toxin [Phycisphaerae bacterium]